MIFCPLCLSARPSPHFPLSAIRRNSPQPPSPFTSLFNFTLTRPLLLKFMLATKRLKIHKKRVERRASSVESCQSSVLSYPFSVASQPGFRVFSCLSLRLFFLLDPRLWSLDSTEIATKRLKNHKEGVERRASSVGGCGPNLLSPISLAREGEATSPACAKRHPLPATRHSLLPRHTPVPDFPKKRLQLSHCPVPQRLLR